MSKPRNKQKTTTPSPKKTLFEPVVAAEKLCKAFNHLRSRSHDDPARWMLDDIYQTFDDPEGNFLEQFQTTGFDARYFELYLFAYFSRSGFTVDRSHPNPDFLVSKNGITVAIEATTINPSTSGVLSRLGKKISDLSMEELKDYQRSELPIRFGGPLFSKLQKKYWELPHCRVAPFVIAIEAFHDEEAHVMSDNALSSYLFGIEQTGSWDISGKLQVATSAIVNHSLGEKVVRSQFFGQPDTEHISAVIFTNSGTNAKFARMGFQHGIGCDVIDIVRLGYSYNFSRDALDPTYFSYSLDAPPLVESWGQGLVVLHNPSCLRPVPRDFFVDAVQGYVEDGAVKTDLAGWHPFSSKTLIFQLGELKKKMSEALPYRKSRFAIGAITKQEFQELCGFVVDDANPFTEEDGWFSDETEAFIGVIVRDKIDNDWGFVVLARDQFFQFRAIAENSSLATRDQARMQLQRKMAELVSSPQRLFSQGKA